MIIYYILGGVKVKLIKADFNNRYLMLSAIARLVVPAPKQTFFASSKELFSLRLGYDNNLKSSFT
jgi:hypothetical protein